MLAAAYTRRVLHSHEGIDNDRAKHADEYPEVVQPKAHGLILAVDPALRIVSEPVSERSSDVPMRQLEHICLHEA